MSLESQLYNHRTQFFHWNIFTFTNTILSYSECPNGNRWLKNTLLPKKKFSWQTSKKKTWTKVHPNSCTSFTFRFYRNQLNAIVIKAMKSFLHMHFHGEGKQKKVHSENIVNYHTTAATWQNELCMTKRKEKMRWTFCSSREHLMASIFPRLG